MHYTLSIIYNFDGSTLLSYLGRQNSQRNTNFEVQGYNLMRKKNVFLIGSRFLILLTLQLQSIELLLELICRDKSSNWFVLIIYVITYNFLSKHVSFFFIILSTNVLLFFIFAAASRAQSHTQFYLNLFDACRFHVHRVRTTCIRQFEIYIYVQICI